MRTIAYWWKTFVYKVEWILEWYCYFGWLLFCGVLGGGFASGTVTACCGHAGLAALVGCVIGVIAMAMVFTSDLRDRDASGISYRRGDRLKEKVKG